MRLVALIFLAGLAACSKSQTPSTAKATPAEKPKPATYSVMLRDDGQTWCAYKDAAEFKAEAEKVKPTDSARVTLSAEKLSEVTYQVEAGLVLAVVQRHAIGALDDLLTLARGNGAFHQIVIHSFTSGLALTTVSRG